MRNTNIDIEELRERLKDYYGTAMFGGFPMAVINLADIETASDEKIIMLARKAGLIYQ